MSNKFQQILLYEKPLFSLYELSTATVDPKIKLPAESCFAYILKGENQDLTNSGFVAREGTVIISLCGKTVGSTLSKNTSGCLISIVVHFDRDVLKKVFDGKRPKYWKDLDQPLKKDIAQEDASVLISSYFFGISNFFKHKSVLNEDILVLKLKEIVLLLLQTNEPSQLYIIARSLFSDRVFSFQEVIETHIYEPLNLIRLAAMTNNSLASFKRKFRKIYQDSPGRYIRKKKLEGAKILIRSSQKSISDICYECGFSNPSSFSRMFKSEYGKSPFEYRLSRNAY